MVRRIPRPDTDEVFPVAVCRYRATTTGASLFLLHRSRRPRCFRLRSGGKILETTVGEGHCRSEGRADKAIHLREGSK